jgi:hypothetical protein
MCVPYELVEVLLSQEFTALEADLLSYPIMEDLDLFEMCIPLLEYLQIASKQPTMGNPRHPTLQDRLGLADGPVCPAVLNRRRTSILHRLLPALQSSDMGRLPDSFVESLSDGLTNATRKMHADRRSREMRVSEATRRKTFRERYGDRIAVEMLLLTSSADDGFLPALYQELGGKSKGGGQSEFSSRGR